LERSGAVVAKKKRQPTAGSVVSTTRAHSRPEDRITPVEAGLGSSPIAVLRKANLALIRYHVMIRIVRVPVETKRRAD
jgi:hypothetical protein